MKKILFVLMLFGANVVFAQGLFPELAEFGGREKKTAKEEVKQAPAPQAEAKKDKPSVQDVIKLVNAGASDEELPDIVVSEEEVESLIEEYDKAETEKEKESAEEQDLFAVKQETESVVPDTPEATEETQEEEEDEEQRIIIFMTQAERKIPANYNFAYCFGTLKYANLLRRPIQALDFVLTYGELPTSFSVRDIPKGGEKQSDQFALVGEACNYIMDMPQITIKSCVVEGMDEAKCKKKVVFLPLKE